MDSADRFARQSALARVFLGVLAVICLVLAFGIKNAQSASVPIGANPHRELFVREATRVFGPNAPIAALAAQIHAESLWNCKAVSRVGALGCAQFMPKTAAWMPTLAPDLVGVDPRSPTWAFRAFAVYMGWLHGRVRSLNGPDSPFPPMDACSRLAFAERGYNGGEGHLTKDRRAAQRLGINPDAWRAVGIVNGAGRSPGNFLENTEYPVKILLRFQALYLSWGRGIDCAALNLERKPKGRPILVLRRRTGVA